MRTHNGRTLFGAMVITTCLVGTSFGQVGLRFSPKSSGGTGGVGRPSSSAPRGSQFSGRSVNLPSAHRLRSTPSAGQRNVLPYGGGNSGRVPLPANSLGGAVVRRVQGQAYGQGQGQRLNAAPLTGQSVGSALSAGRIPGIQPGSTPATQLKQQVLPLVQQPGLKNGLKQAVARELGRGTGGALSGVVDGPTATPTRRRISEAIKELGVAGLVPTPPGGLPGNGNTGSGNSGGTGGGHEGHHHGGHPHHGHHHPWLVIRWTPGFFAPPVQHCPAPPVVVCPPPAPICPPPADVIVVETPVSVPSDSESPTEELVGNAADQPAVAADSESVSPATDESTHEGQTEPQSEEIDLQVEYVQMVETGNSQQQQGPLYRVWIVNHGTAPVVRPFDVVLVATNEESPADDAPYAAQRVARIDAGARLSVEIRLPAEVLQLAVDAEGLPVPFKNLFAAVDVQQELAELNEQNNALGLARQDVPDAALLAKSE